MIDVPEYQEIDLNEYERKTRAWELKFCWLPQRCIETMQVMWLQFAYRGYKARRYDTQIIDSYKWMCKEEFIILRLKGEV
jgi:hypothetical protein